MPELDADFEISTNNLEAEYEISEGEHFDCSFEIYASGTTFSSIMGSPYDNEALTEALNQKADNSTVETLSETVTNNYNTLDGKIDTHIADKTNPHEVTKAQIGLGNVDNTSDLNKPISTATQTALNGKQNTINDLSEIRTNASNGQSAYNTIQTYGDIVTYDASNFATSIQGQKADTALQPNDNISELNNDIGYITGIDSEDVTDALGYTPYNSTNPDGYQENVIESIEVNGTAQTITSKTVNITVPTTASDINAVPTSRTINNKALTSNITLNSTDVGALSSTTTIYDLTTSTQQSALDSGANTTNIGQIATNTQAISDETTARENADIGLQQQIDAIVSSSDVFDIVGTYAELQAYDISTVPVNDIIKVLVDSTHNDAATYYRCTENGGVKSWTYIGSEGPYYTKSEADAEFVPQTRTINNKALSNNITLDAADVGALPSSTTIGSGVLTIQKNGTPIDTFGANDTGNTTVNVTVPTDTSDLTNTAGYITGINSTDVTTALGYTPYNSSNPNGYTNNVGTVTSVNNTNPDSNGNVSINIPTKTSDLTNDSGFIDSSALSNYATQTDLTSGLATKQDTLTAGTDLEIVYTQHHNLPVGYTELESLQSTGTQYIDTGLKVNSNDWGFKAIVKPSNNSDMGAVGSIIPSSNENRWFGVRTRDNSSFVYGFGGYFSATATQNYVNVKTTIELNYLDSLKAKIGNDSADLTRTNDIISGYNIRLFGVSDSLTWSGVGYEFWITKGQNTIAHYIPAKRNSDNVLGVYDLISDTFIAGSGTGTFITGAEIIPCKINFTNTSGYTTNVGTVTSVNNTQPDANGNVTLTIPSAGANTDLSNLTATGEAHFQTPLVSGTDIKTINNTSILGSGNIDTSEIFIATYGTTTYNEIKTAITNGKIVLAKAYNLYYSLTLNSSTVYSFSYFLSDACYIVEVTNGNLWSNGSYTYQQTSTAVTHTANTAVGNSTTPVYINSSGAAASTGLSIASTRFDTAVTYKYSAHSLTTFTGTKTISLSSYLPSDSNTYQYNVLVSGYMNNSNSTISVVKINGSSSMTTSMEFLRAGSGGRYQQNSLWLPVDTGKTITVDVSNGSVSNTLTVELCAYRRIGTNS